MFKENKKVMSENTLSSSNRIVVETKFKGEVSSKSDFRIDGELEGDIQTSGKLVVGRTGVIKGNVVCKNADIEGRVEGHLRVNNVLTLKSSAVIEGEVFVQKLAIEPGAVFNVSCTMKEAKNSDTKTTVKEPNARPVTEKVNK